MPTPYAAFNKTGKYHPSTYRIRAQKMKPEILITQEGKCGRCDKNITNIPITKVDVHHIDGDPSNNSLSNLIVLCKSCHMQTHWDMENKSHIFNSKNRRKYGFTPKDQNIKRTDNLVPWEDIKNETHATYVSNGWGYRKQTKWVEDTGYTLQEIGDYMGISKERVRQLLEKGSPRIPIVVEQMKKEHVYS